MSGSIKTSRNGRDRSREAERRAADAAREKRGRELDQAILDAEKRVARLDARREVLMEQALANDALREALRIALWAKVPGAITGRSVDGEAMLTAPEGLPTGMSEDDFELYILSALHPK